MKPLEEKAKIYRGEILHECIWMEKCIDSYIADYFTSDGVRANEMHTLFLGGNRMTLDNKRQVFTYLAQKHDSEWLKEYTSPRILEGKKTKPYTLDKDIDYVIQIRNILAHLYFDANHSDNDTLQFIKFNNVRHKTPIDDRMFMTVQLVMHKIVLHILRKLSFLKGTLSSPFINEFESHLNYKVSQ